MVQLNYTIDTPVALRGMPGDAGLDRKIVSGSAQAQIAFGKYVCHNAGGGDAEVTLPASATDVTDLGRGFAIADTSREFDADGYETDEAVPVMEEGSIWVYVEDAVGVEDPVFVRHSSGSFSDIGVCRSDADTATAAELPNAKFATSTSAAGLALVVFNKRT